MAYFMAQYSFNFVGAHMLHQASTDRHQGVVFAEACGKCIGVGRFKDAHLRHANARP